MPKPLPKILLDLTPLATPGGARGIGRFIRELARGLAELPREELEGIELIGLTSLSWSGAYTVTSDFASFLEASGTALLTAGDYYSWAYRQRFALWLAAARLHATAVHITDPHGTPRFLGIAGTKRIVTCYDLSSNSIFRSLLWCPRWRGCYRTLHRAAALPERRLSNCNQ